MSPRTLTRLCASRPPRPPSPSRSSPPPAPTSAPPSATPRPAPSPSLTFSVPHGCDGLAHHEDRDPGPRVGALVTPTRNPLYDVEANIEQLDEPVTDAHGNEVTERVGSIVYTAQTPLPDGQRDTFELSFQVPDAAGETLAFPTIQTCEQGETGLDRRSPADGQDAEELEYPAPAFDDPARQPRRATTTARPRRPPRPSRRATRPTPRTATPPPSAGPGSGPACSASWPAVSPWPGRARPRDHAGAAGGWRRAPLGLRWSPPRCSRSLAGAGGASPASAHAELVSTDPTEGAVLETAPAHGHAHLQRAGPADLAGGRGLRRRGRAGRRSAGAGGADVSIELAGAADLADGTYVVVVVRALHRRPPDLGLADVLGRRAAATRWPRRPRRRPPRRRSTCARPGHRRMYVGLLVAAGLASSSPSSCRARTTGATCAPARAACWRRRRGGRGRAVLRSRSRRSTRRAASCPSRVRPSTRPGRRRAALRRCWSSSGSAWSSRP